MKLSAIALDYDGTIAVNGQMDPSVRGAIGDVRDAGIPVVLVTGRRLDDLRRVAGDLACFDVIVAENGAVVDFGQRRRHVVLGHPPPRAFIAELERRGIACAVGEALIEADANTSPVLIETIHALQMPLVLTFNRGRVMALPQAIGKSTGLRHALTTLRLSLHNAIAIGDAENDYDLLDACEVGVAVEWGSPALQAAADEVVRGSGPAAVAGYLREIVRRGQLAPAQMGRRSVVLGRQHDGTPVNLAVRGRTVVVAGEPGTGKSWIAGLEAEQLILMGYCLCVIDPEGDYASLEALPGVIRLGGDDPPPTARELTRALRFPDVSVIVDLSKLRLSEKIHHMETITELLLRLRRRTGLPHRIIIDEAHYLFARRPAWTQDQAELRGQTFVTYRVSALTETAVLPDDVVVLVTRESDPREVETLCCLCRSTDVPVPATVLRDLRINEAAILPGPEESGGCVTRFEIAPRLTMHVRHRTKYLDMPVSDWQAFVFTANGRPVARAQTLKEFARSLMVLPEGVVEGHLRRHDFSRWINGVFRDGVLAARLRALEATVDTEAVPEIVLRVDQTIHARYERVRQDIVQSDQAEARSL